MVLRSAVVALQEATRTVSKAHRSFLGAELMARSYSWFLRSPASISQPLVIHGMVHTDCSAASNYVKNVPLLRRWSTNHHLGCLGSFRASHTSSVGVVSPAPAKLNDLVVLENFESLPAEGIVMIWKTFFQNKPAEVPVALHVDEWQTMQKRMHESKMAVLPVHKAPVPNQLSENCFMSMLCQAQMPKHILITGLASFQQFGADAHPSIVVTFYDEMVHSKHIVLGRADILDCGLLTKAEAGKLLHDLVLCYTNDELYQQIAFLNQSSSQFNFDMFVDSLLRLQV